MKNKIPSEFMEQFVTLAQGNPDLLDRMLSIATKLYNDGYSTGYDEGYDSGREDGENSGCD